MLRRSSPASPEASKSFKPGVSMVPCLIALTGAYEPAPGTCFATSRIMSRLPMTRWVISVLLRPVALPHDVAVVNGTKDISPVPPKGFLYRALTVLRRFAPAEFQTHHLRIADGTGNRGYSPELSEAR